LLDKRRGSNKRYTMVDIGLAACSVFFTQSPSFLAHQRQLEQGRGRSNCQTLFGMAEIPCDNHIRAMLDPVEPTAFHPVFGTVLGELERSGGMAEFRRLDGHVLIAFDGTEYFRSNKVHCPHCSSRARAGGKTEYFHSLMAAKSRAARRWLSAHGERYARLRPVYLGDDLYSRQPICQAVLEAGGHFLFVCKPDSHPTLQEYLTGIDLPTLEKRVKRGRERFVYRYRWLCELPLRDGRDALHVNWLSIEIVNPAGEITYRNSFVTDLPVDRANVAELADCGRARWKIENESFNTLKTKGYNLEHNFGHGKDNLSAVLATLNLLAFAFHTICELAEDLWSRAIQAQGRRTRFFEALRSLTVFWVFSSWDDLIATLAFAKPPPIPP
jgi:hypothetical protein